MTVEQFDALVVGAGPAGMSAAIEICRHGGSVHVVDEQSAPGGQIYRAAENATKKQAKIFGETYRRGADLISEFRASGCTYSPNTTVVNVDPNLNADVVSGGKMWRIDARQLVLATGAYERPVPLEGWTLPGVMTAGAAQVLAKQSGVVPSGRVALVGNGPLLWLLAWQFRRLGVDLTAIVEMDVNRRPSGTWDHLGGFLVSPYARDGLKYLLSAQLRTRKVRASGAVRILGESEVTGIEIARRKSSPVLIDADVVLVHDGIIPSVHLPGAAGCDLKWSISQRAWRPNVDAWQRADGCAGIHVVGDGASIQGAGAAEATGAIAATDVLFQTGKLTESERDVAALKWRSAHRRHMRGRRFIDSWFTPVEAVRLASPTALVCRCEAVTRADAETALRSHPDRLAHLKSTTRCGMGPCQGRMCMPSIGSLAKHEIGVHPTCIGPPSFRFPTKPVNVATLAGFETADQSVEGSIRE